MWSLWLQKKGMTTIFVSPLSFVAVFGSGIRYPGSGMGKNQDPGSGINIPDPWHCFFTGTVGQKLLPLEKILIRNILRTMLSFRSFSSFIINVSQIWMTMITEDRSGLRRTQEVDTVTVSRPHGIRFDPAASLFIGQVHAWNCCNKLIFQMGLI